MTIDQQRTLLALVTGSVGGQTWRHLFDTNGQDLLEDGNLSCAYFASSILLTAGLIKGMHATVDGCRRDLVQSDWQQTESPTAGNIVIWPAGPNGHQHIGFYIESTSAISNSSTKRSPQQHSLNFDGQRPPSEFWTTKN